MIERIIEEANKLSTSLAGGLTSSTDSSDIGTNGSNLFQAVRNVTSSLPEASLSASQPSLLSTICWSLCFRNTLFEGDFQVALISYVYYDFIL